MRGLKVNFSTCQLNVFFGPIFGSDVNHFAEQFSIRLEVVGACAALEAPFVSDPGDSYRCVACQRDFQSLDNVMQHLRTSKRHAPLT